MGLLKTWKEVMFDPMNFYEELSKEVRYKEPSLFFIKIYAILLAIGAIFLLAFGAFLLLPLLGAAETAIGGLGVSIILLAILFLFPLFLLLAWGMLFVSAGLNHLFVLLFGGKEGYKETFKATAYSLAPSVFSMIPLVNWLAYIYIVILQVIGIHKRQKLSMGRSIAVVLLPAVIVMLIFLLFYLLALP